MLYNERYTVLGGTVYRRGVGSVTYLSTKKGVSAEDFNQYVYFNGSIFFIEHIFICICIYCIYEVSSIKNVNLSIKLEGIKIQKCLIACKKGINVVVRFQYSEIS